MVNSLRGSLPLEKDTAACPLKLSRDPTTKSVQEDFLDMVGVMIRTYSEASARILYKFIDGVFITNLQWSLYFQFGARGCIIIFQMQLTLQQILGGREMAWWLKYLTIKHEGWDSDSRHSHKI